VRAGNICSIHSPCSATRGTIDAQTRCGRLGFRVGDVMVRQEVFAHSYQNEQMYMISSLSYQLGVAGQVGNVLAQRHFDNFRAFVCKSAR